MSTETTPPSAAGLYREQRERGKSDAEAAAAVGHAYNRRGQDLEIMLERPRRKYERETAGRPDEGSRSGVPA